MRSDISHRGATAGKRSRRWLVLAVTGTFCLAAEAGPLQNTSRLQPVVDTALDTQPGVSAAVDEVLLDASDRHAGDLIRYLREAENAEPLDEARREAIRTDLIQAFRHLERGETTRGSRKLNKVLREAPYDADFLRQAAPLSAAFGNYETAARLYRKAVVRSGADVSLLSGWAAVELRLNRMDEADVLIRTAMRQDPEYLPAVYVRALLRAKRNEPPATPGRWRDLPETRVARLESWILADREALLRHMSREQWKAFCLLMLGKEDVRERGVERASIFHYLLSETR